MPRLAGNSESFFARIAADEIIKAEMVNTWDDKNDELDECIENSKANDAQLSRNTDGSAAISFTNEDAPRATARYSASSVRAARTVCLFVSFFGLVSY